MTWREQATPAGRRLFRHAASMRPIAEIDFGSWPTPTASDWKGANPLSRIPGDDDLPTRVLRTALAMWPTPQHREKGGGEYADPAKALARLTSGHQVNLQDAVKAMHAGPKAAAKLWPTPAARDYRMPNNPDGASRATRPETSGKQLPNEVVQALWSTPRASDAEKGSPNQAFGGGGQPLPSQAYQAAAMWPTPTAMDPMRGLTIRPWDTGVPLPQMVGKTLGLTPSGSLERTESLGGLGCAFVTYLMGYPQTWLDHAPTKTPKKSAKPKA